MAKKAEKNETENFQFYFSQTEIINFCAYTRKDWIALKKSKTDFQY